MTSDLALALALLDEADRIALPPFRAGSVAAERKADRTTVTAVDRAVERALRARLAAERPGDAVLGEELGGSEGARRRWVLDPVDGTEQYVRGIPVWGTLVALECEGEPVVGAVSAPALGRRWWAARGEGAFADGRRIEVSRVDRLEDALLAHSNVGAMLRGPLRDGFAALAQRCRWAGGYESFWAHMLVAEGAAEIALVPRSLEWDRAAAAAIVREAGGRFEVLPATEAWPGALAVNAALHAQVRAALA